MVCMIINTLIHLTLSSMKNTILRKSKVITVTQVILLYITVKKDPNFIRTKAFMIKQAILRYNQNGIRIQKRLLQMIQIINITTNNKMALHQRILILIRTNTIMLILIMPHQTSQRKAQKYQILTVMAFNIFNIRLDL